MPVIYLYYRSPCN